MQQPGWDIAFMLAQKQAIERLSVQPISCRMHLCSLRQPDHGYSLRGDGSDYTLWNEASSPWTLISWLN
jgi:hypothetical protein